MAITKNHKTPLLTYCYQVLAAICLFGGIIGLMVGAFSGDPLLSRQAFAALIPCIVGFIICLGFAEVIDLIAQIAHNTATSAANSTVIASNTYLVATNTAPSVQGNKAGQPLP